jgi:RNA polymerase sigma-70 factor (ECF subfamily)
MGLKTQSSQAIPMERLLAKIYNPEEVKKTEEMTADSECFIRKAFEIDPRQGCDLLFRYYYQPLCSHAVRFLYSKTIAEDIVSEVFYQFYLKGTYKEINTSYRAYLYKAVRSRAYNYLRWDKKQLTDLTAAQYIPETRTEQPDSVTQYEELYHDVENAINSLPPQCRKIYLMHRFEGKKYHEIALELQLAPKTIEVQIRKASQTLREILKNKWALLLLLIAGLYCRLL